MWNRGDVKKRVSSAKKVSMEGGESASLLMSMIHKINMSGPRINPCGTLESVWHGEERKPEIVAL